MANPATEKFVQTHIERLLDDTLGVRRRTEKPALENELERLERMVEWAVDAYPSWREALTPRRSELALWLYGVAIGVAANGLGPQALALLDVLPGVPAGAEGRRELLQALLAARDARADLGHADLALAS